jgi:SAM-dependent methyltransferase
MNKREKDTPIALDAYEQMAEKYNALIETAPYNAYLERPAILSLLPDVKGMHVLDAGCGPGFYTEILLDRGATVTAIDVSPKMIQFAKQRVGNRATIRRANLEEPLDFITNRSVDLVFSSLVLDYVNDWESLFTEFSRILIDDGYFLFSTEHPFSKFSHDKYPDIETLAENYHEKEYMELYWSSHQVLVPSYRRPLGMFFECLGKAGLCFEKLIETRPTEDFKRHHPEDYDKTARKPTFLCIRARKRL